MKNRNIPFFFGPLQMIASSEFESRNPMDITDKLSSTYCKKHMKRTVFHRQIKIKCGDEYIQTFCMNILCTERI
jgi:hypothetical protein